MALNTLKCNYLTPLHFKGLSLSASCKTVVTCETQHRSKWFQNDFSVFVSHV